MAELTLEGIVKRFGPVRAVDGVDMALADGAFICFLGPSGCGKTTLLRLIAGLETPTAGRIMLDGADITGVPTHRRNVGMVFQSLALFPHLSLGDNIAYGMRIAGIDAARRRDRVEALLELVQLPGLADRAVSQLSGGQRQRVAIARALALEPGLFLLDEPLSALDAKLREAMQVELRMLQQRLGVTTILVTHDQREAMTMSDLIAVMGEGRIQQVGTPLEIYRNPANAFVADFIGTTNMVEAVVADANTVRIGDHPLGVEAMPPGVSAGAVVDVSIRPEDVTVVPAGAAHGQAGATLAGRVGFIRDIGATVETYVDCDGLKIIAAASPKDRPAVGQGDEAVVVIPPAACVVLKR